MKTCGVAVRFSAWFAIGALAVCGAAQSAPCDFARDGAPMIVFAPLPSGSEARAALIESHLTPFGAQWLKAETGKLASGEEDADGVARDTATACAQPQHCFDQPGMSDPASSVFEFMLLYQEMLNREARADHMQSLADVREEREARARRIGLEEQKIWSMREEAGTRYQHALDTARGPGFQGDCERSREMSYVRQAKLATALAGVAKKIDEIGPAPNLK